ncbi:MAG: formate/nitrite transporter family protein [Clostridiales bacterium]|nr:formate/nitrite transporter family protein [Clostridiales bacterium]
MRINTPAQIAQATLQAGIAKTNSTRGNKTRLTLQAIMAGAFIAFGGTLSLIVGYGFPEITSGNPGLQKLLSGAMFPIGLILVVILGAELFTGNNALLVPAYMRRHATIRDMLLNWTIVYLGNFIGALLFTYFLVYSVGLISAHPYQQAITSIGIAKTSMPWITVFLKGIGANWCVCLAVWLAMSGKTLLEKSLGCWLPVMAFVALGYEHSIANMFYIPAAMLEGASIDIANALWKNLLPATLGNIAGGAILVGWLHSYVHLNSDGMENNNHQVKKN